MLNLFKEYATDTNAEIKGVKVPLKGQIFYVARSNNREYAKLLSTLVNENQIIIDGKDEAADKKSDEIMIEVMAKTILKGWEHPMVVEQNGEPVPYSVENAKKALSFRDFRVEIMRIADDRARYLLSKDEEKEKN